MAGWKRWYGASLVRVLDEQVELVAGDAELGFGCGDGAADAGASLVEALGGVDVVVS